MGLWGSSKKQEKPTNAIVPVKPSAALVTVEDEEVEEEMTTEIVVRKGTTIQKAPTTGLAQVQSRSKEIMIAGEKKKTNPQQLIRCIKRITQQIGEYKGTNDIYATVVVTALRKARGDFVSVLENEFHINWQIDPNTGVSVFYMG